MMTVDFLLRLSALLIGLIVVGCLMCLPFYKWKLRAFFASSLFTKIIWWVPIFIVLLIILYTELAGAVGVTVLIMLVASWEFIRNRGYTKWFASLYFLIFLLMIAHLAGWFLYVPDVPGVPGTAILLAAVCVVSVLSDVIAFFLGNYMGRHKLPGWINNHKSWEGVLGQILGAGVGALLVWWFLQVALPISLVVLIGVGSAVGDVMNSIAKRSLQIKDWGQTIPGHGGMLDRLSSLSVAIAVSLWFLRSLP